MKEFLKIVLSKYKDPKLAMWMKLTFMVILVFNLCAGIFYPLADRRKVLLLFLSMTVLLGMNCLISRRKEYRWLDTITFLLLFLPNIHLFRGGEIGYFSMFYLLLFSLGTIFILGIRMSLLFQILGIVYLHVRLRGPGFEQLLSTYNRNMLLRFPYLYLCIIGIAYIIMFSIQRYWVEKEQHMTILAKRIQSEKLKLADMSLHVVTAMYSALSAKVPEIDKHCEQVAKYSRDLAKRMGLNEAACTNAYYAGLLHEVGAVGLPDEIIQKSKLTDAQYEVYKTYVTRGYRIVRELQIADEAAEAILYSRENYDGSGYQEGLFGKNIPLLSRILILADYADRHSRWGESPDEICQKIRALKGTQFDPECAENMCALLKCEP